MHTTYSLQIYQSIISRVFSWERERFFLNESLTKAMLCFVAIFQAYTNKAKRTQNLNATVNYHKYLKLLHFLKEFRQQQKCHDHTLAGLFPVFAAELLNGQEDFDLKLEKIFSFFGLCFSEAIATCCIFQKKLKTLSYIVFTHRYCSRWVWFCIKNS